MHILITKDLKRLEEFLQLSEETEIETSYISPDGLSQYFFIETEKAWRMVIQNREGLMVLLPDQCDKPEGFAFIADKEVNFYLYHFLDSASFHQALLPKLLDQGISLPSEVAGLQHNYGKKANTTAKNKLIKALQVLAKKQDKEEIQTKKAAEKEATAKLRSEKKRQQLELKQEQQRSAQFAAEQARADFTEQTQMRNNEQSRREEIMAEHQRDLDALKARHHEAAMRHEIGLRDAKKNELEENNRKSRAYLKSREGRRLLIPIVSPIIGLASAGVITGILFGVGALSVIFPPALPLAGMLAISTVVLTLILGAVTYFSWRSIEYADDPVILSKEEIQAEVNKVKWPESPASKPLFSPRQDLELEESNVASPINAGPQTEEAAFTPRDADELSSTGTPSTEARRSNSPSPVPWKKG